MFKKKQFILITRNVNNTKKKQNIAMFVPEQFQNIAMSVPEQFQNIAMSVPEQFQNPIEQS